MNVALEEQSAAVHARSKNICLHMFSDLGLFVSVDGWKDGWMNRWMNGWMNGWMDGKMHR